MASAGNIDSLSVPGNLKGSVRASGNIGTLSVGLAETATISAGESITSIGSFDYAGPTVVDSNINAGSSIYAISSSGNIEGSITAGGQIGLVSPPVGATTPADTGLIAGFDITATVHAGPIITYQAGRDATGTVTTKGNVGGISVGRDFDVSSWSTNPGSGIYSAETGAVGAITIGRDAIGAISAAGGFASINIGRSDDVSLTSSAGGLESLTVGGSDGLTEFSDGSVTKSISTLSDIGNVSIYIAPGQSPTPSAFNITVNSPTASLGNFTDDGSYNGYIDVGLNIGTVRIGSTIGGDLAGSIKAEHGYIGQIIVHQGNLTSALTAAANLGYTPFAGYSIEADGNVTGAINAGGDIAPVISNTGNVDSTIISSAGGIAGVQAYLGSIDGNNITAYNSIGDITAGKEISAPITAINGSIGDVSAGTVSAQGSVAFLIPQADDSRVSFNGVSYVVNEILDQFAGVGGSDISGNLNANSGIGSISALGKISANITSGAGIGNILASDDISGNITDQSSVTAASWGGISSNINAAFGITLNAYKSISGALNAASGDLAAVSWLNISSNVDVGGNAYLWAAGNISGGGIHANSAMLVTTYGATPSIIAWGNMGDSISTTESMDVLANSVTNVALTSSQGGLIVSAAASISNVTASSNVMNGYVGTTVYLLCYGDIINWSEPVGGYNLAIICKDFSGNVDADQSVLVKTEKDVLSGTILTSDNSSVEVDSENINATVNAATTVTINAYGNVQGSITAAGGATVTASGVVSSSITVSGGSASIFAGGGVSSTTSANQSIGVTSLNSVQGKYTTTNGSVSVQAAGNISGSYNGSSGVALSGTMNVAGMQTSSGGDVDIQAGGDFTGTVFAGHNASVQAGGSVSAAASIFAGLLPGSTSDSPPVPSGAYSASVTSYGGMDGTVHASSNVNIFSAGDIEGTATADTGFADLSTAGNDSGNAFAATRILVFSDSVTHSVLTCSTGGVAITAVHDVDVSITAFTAAAVEAGGVLSISITLNGIGGSITLAAGGAVNAEINNAPVSVIKAFAGGDMTFTAGTDGDNPSDGIMPTDPLSISLMSFGAIKGSAYSIGYISASAWGTISQFTAKTLGSTSTISLFAKGPIDANVNSGDALTIVSLDSITGTYLADSTSASTGTAELDATKDINATVTAINDASLTAGGQIQGEVYSGFTAELNSGGPISASVTAELSDATVWSIQGDITGNITAGGNADVLSGHDISGSVTAGGSATVSSLGTISSQTTAGQNATVSADTAVTGDVTAAGGNATVYAGTINADVCMQGRVRLLSAEATSLEQCTPPQATQSFRALAT